MTTLAPLQMPGATLMTRLKVYDTPTPDGQLGGTPHVHLACSEMYVVLAGSGAVEIIDHSGFSRVDLAQHDALVFTPGTVHRLINPNADLEILVIMENSGLPEQGDNVVTFREDILATDKSYADAMRVTSVSEAYQRRDKGVEGFLELKAAFETSPETGVERLKRFYELARARTAHRLEAWEARIQQGALAAAQTSLAQVAALSQGKTDHLLNNQMAHIRAEDQTAPGFCGHLNRYFDPATLHMEGQQTS